MRIEVFLNGLMAGVLYALVALGFRFDLQGIWHFQLRPRGDGAVRGDFDPGGHPMPGQVPFAHVINAIVRHGSAPLSAGTVPALLAIIVTVAVMVLILLGLLGAEIVSSVKHLVGQEPIILFMATIGLAYFLEGVGDLMWGSEIKKLDVGHAAGRQPLVRAKDTAIRWRRCFDYGFYIDNLDIVGDRASRRILVGGLVILFSAVHQRRAAPCGPSRMTTRRHCPWASALRRNLGDGLV